MSRDEEDDAPEEREEAAGHCVMIENGIACTRCGDEYRYRFPADGAGIPVWEVVSVGRGFEKEHRDCAADPEAVAARYRSATAQEWLNGWDVGRSSKTIVAALSGLQVGGEPGVPHDPQDFARCARLLEQPFASGWRARLGEVGGRFPIWRRYVEAWAEMEALFAEESPTGKAPKLFAKLQELAR
jgi:hypothetical protein